MLQSSCPFSPVSITLRPCIIQEGFRGSLVEYHPAPSPLFLPSALCLLVLHRRGPGPSQQPPSSWGLVADLLPPAHLCGQEAQGHWGSRVLQPRWGAWAGEKGGAAGVAPPEGIQIASVAAVIKSTFC